MCKRTNIIAWLKLEKATSALGNQTHNLALHFGKRLFWLCFLAFPAPRCCGWVVECTHMYPCSGGFHSSGLGWTRPTTCAPFAQTAASHSLDCSTALPVPVKLIDLLKLCLHLRSKLTSSNQDGRLVLIRISQNTFRKINNIFVLTDVSGRTKN